MIQHGAAPFLECSSRGDRRFSAFAARIKRRANKSIEEIYQGANRSYAREGWRRLADVA
jgi:hypothetical protein